MLVMVSASLVGEVLPKCTADHLGIDPSRSPPRLFPTCCADFAWQSITRLLRLAVSLSSTESKCYNCNDVHSHTRVDCLKVDVLR